MQNAIYGKSVTVGKVDWKWDRVASRWTALYKGYTLTVDRVMGSGAAYKYTVLHGSKWLITTACIGAVYAMGEAESLVNKLQMGDA